MPAWVMYLGVSAAEVCQNCLACTHLLAHPQRFIRSAMALFDCLQNA